MVVAIGGVEGTNDAQCVTVSFCDILGMMMIRSETASAGIGDPKWMHL